jgi:hypothetical protein
MVIILSFPSSCLGTPISPKLLLRKGNGGTPHPNPKSFLGSYFKPQIIFLLAPTGPILTIRQCMNTILTR